MNSKMTTITAQQFVDEGYAAKIATGECVVKSPLYSEEIVSAEHVIKQNSESWDVAITDTKSTYRTYSNVELWVTWLPQPATASEDTVPNPYDELDAVGNAVAAINAALMLEQPNKASFHLMAIEEFWLEAQTELAALREQVAALRESLRFCGDMSDGLHNHISVRGAMSADEVIRTLGLITKRAKQL